MMTKTEFRNSFKHFPLCNYIKILIQILNVLFLYKIGWTNYTPPLRTNTLTSFQSQVSVSLLQALLSRNIVLLFVIVLTEIFLNIILRNKWVTKHKILTKILQSTKSWRIFHEVKEKEDDNCSTIFWFPLYFTISVFISYIFD